MKTFWIVSTIISSFSWFPHDWIDNFPIRTPNLPSHVIKLDAEIWRPCFVIDEISVWISKQVITLCSWTQPIKDEWSIVGEVCWVYEFSINPQYAFLFPWEQTVRACISED